VRGAAEPTGVTASGTIEEIEKHRGAKKPTMIYFSNAPVPHDVDTKQYEDDRKLRRKYESEGLLGTFEHSEDFRRVFTHDLTARMVDGSSNQNARAVIPCAFDFGEFNLKRRKLAAGVCR
jgi:hypothetical protein